MRDDDELLLWDNSSFRYMHGYNVVIGSDITSSDFEDLHDAEIRTLRRGFAMVLSCEDIVAAIESVDGGATQD